MESYLAVLSLSDDSASGVGTFSVFRCPQRLHESEQTNKHSYIGIVSFFVTSGQGRRLFIQIPRALPSSVRLEDSDSAVTGGADADPLRTRYHQQERAHKAKFTLT